MKKTVALKMNSIKIVLLLIVMTGLSGVALGANFTVTKVADTNDNVCDADCSLREAITVANRDVTADTIIFDPFVFGFNTPQTIILTGGELKPTNTLTINGTGANLLNISGNNASRVFYLEPNANLTIFGLKVSGGNGVGQVGSGNGGAFLTSRPSILTVNNSIISDSSANNGGAQYITGQLNLFNSTVTNNSAVGSGGGVYTSAAGTIQVINSVISNNTATHGGGLVTSNSGNSTLFMSRATIAANHSDNNGGGLSIFCRATLNQVGIYNNSAGGKGGGLFTTEGLDIDFNNSVMSRNTSNQGGGGYISTTVFNINNSTIDNNRAVDGGGLYVVNYFAYYTLNAINSTFSDNSATNRGGGIYNGGFTNLTNATVSNNTANIKGGGVFNFVTSEGGNSSVILNNTIVGDNDAPTGPDFSGVVTSEGYNLIENTSGLVINNSLTGLVLGQTPRLGPLLDNGGFTPTRALLTGSPAIDRGNPNNVSTVDQRGVARPQDGDRNGSSLPDIGAFERSINSTNQFDFDGDGKADLSVFRPENGNWYIQQSTNGFTGLQFGLSTDKLAPADYDGDGKTDVAVVRNSNWYLQRSSLGFTGIQFGDGNDVPVPGDYDGDGKAELAVFRPSNGYWYILNITTNQFTATQFGISTDKPVPADYDGDGKTDIAVNRNGNWYIQRSQLGFTGVLFGDSNDRPVPADYDGDGRADIAVFRPSNGSWYLQQSTAGFTGVVFGFGTDSAVPADYDGDGKADIAVVRSGTWYLNRSTQGFTGIAFGTSTDKPIPNSFIR